MRSINFRALLISPIVIFLLGATRLLLVSNYDSDTAVTLFRLGGITDTITGTTLPLLPLILPLLFVTLLAVRAYWVAAVSGVCCLLVAVSSPSFVNFKSAQSQGFDHARWFTLGVVFNISDYTPNWIDSVAKWVFGLLLKPLPSSLSDKFIASNIDRYPRAGSFQVLWTHDWLLTVLVLLAFMGVVGRFRFNSKTGDVEQNESKSGTLLGSLIRLFGRVIIGLLVSGVVIFGYSFISNVYPILPNDSGLWQYSLHRFWQPPEVIQTDKQARLIGYPLGDKDGWSIILRDDDRAILYVHPDEIKSRTVCAIHKPSDKLPLVASSKIKLALPQACYP
jgi:hypothetical protein